MGTRAEGDHAPLRSTLAQVAAREPWLAVHAEVPAGEPGWCCAADLIDQPGALDQLVASAADQLAVDHPGATVQVRRAVAAALLLADWSWALGVLGAGSLALTGRVPELLPSAVWLRWERGRVCGVTLTSREFSCSSEDPDSGHGSASDVADLEGALRAQLQQHLAQLHQRLRCGAAPLLRQGPRAMWGAAGDGLADVLRRQADGRPDAQAIRSIATRVLSGAPTCWGRSNFIDVVDDAGRDQVTRRRTSCCLYYRLPETPPCSSCPRLGAEVASLAAPLAARQSGDDGIAAAGKG